MINLDKQPLGGEVKQWIMFAHLGGLAGLVVPTGSIIVPLVIWLGKKDLSPDIEDQAREALNFQISIMIYGIASTFAMFFVVGFLTMAAVGIVWLVFTIKATIEADRGNKYYYPLNLRLIKPAL